jgi:hypothetical protein
MTAKPHEASPAQSGPAYDETMKALATSLAKPTRSPSALHLFTAIEGLDILDQFLEEFSEQLEANGGDIEAIPEIAELLAFGEDEFKKAVYDWGRAIRVYDRAADANKQEEGYWAQKRRRAENARDRLKEYLKRQLEARKIAKVEGFDATDLTFVRVQRNGQPSIEAQTPDVLEELFAGGSEFVKERRELVIDYDVCVAAIKAEIPPRGKKDPPLTDEQYQAIVAKVLPAGVIAKLGTHLRVG